MGKISISIIEKKRSYTVLECARCSGNGEMQTTHQGTSKKKCETCSGAGKVKVSQTPPFYECGTCEGSGIIKNASGYNTCSTCEGIGVKSSEELESY